MIVLPWHNPVLLAEQAATLDLLSGGRLDFGIGKGYRYNEFAGFDVPMEEADARFEESLEVLLKAWTSEERVLASRQVLAVQRHRRRAAVGAEAAPADLDGRRQRALDPQRRRARLQSAAGTVRVAGRCRAEHRLVSRPAVEASGRRYDPMQVGVTRAFFVTDSAAERDAALDRRLQNRMRQLKLATRPDGTVHGGPDRATGDPQAVNVNSAIYGNPDEIARRLEALQRVGVGYVLINGGGSGGGERGRQSMRRFAREVMPLFSDQAPAQSRGIKGRNQAMLIVDSQIHIWENEKMPDNTGRSPPTRRTTRWPRCARPASMRADPSAEYAPKTNATAIEAARQHPDKFAILGHFAVERPENRELIDTWKQQPGMLGLRFTSIQPHQQSWWTDGTVDWLWPAAERAGTADRAAGRPVISIVAKIAERHPGLRLLIDHMGRSGGAKDDAALPTSTNCSRWRSLPNVAVKFSGAPSYSSESYPWRNIHEHMRRIFDAFGPQRGLLGHRHHAHAVLLSPVRDDVHRGTAVPVRHRPGTGDGPRAVRLDRLETACLEPS